MNIILLDTETTGFEPCDIVEVAYVHLNNLAISHRFGSTNVDWITENARYHHSLYKPDREIHDNASKVHGIYWKDVKNAPHHSTFKLPNPLDIMIGHNIAFDHRVLGKPDVKLLCTLKLCKKVFPRIPGGYSLKNLIEFFYPEERGWILPKNYHRAMDDVKLCYLILVKILQKLEKIETLDQLLPLCETKK